MGEISREKKQIVMEQLGKLVIKEVRDRALKISMDIVTGDTRNCLKKEQYKSLSNLSNEQQEAICDLLSETIADTIYRFLEMFEENSEKVKLKIEFEGKEYDALEISEKMGSEIAYDSAEGWIQKYSKIGRFVL